MITAHIYGNSDKTEGFPNHDLCSKPIAGEEIFLENNDEYEHDSTKFPTGWYRVLSVKHIAKLPRRYAAPYLEIVVEPI